MTLVDPISGDERILDVGVYYGGNKYAWSPDGQWVLYIGDNLGSRGLFLSSSIDDNHPRFVLTAPLLQVAWSPAGDYVAYTTVSIPGRGNELHILPTNELGLSLPISID